MASAQAKQNRAEFNEHKQGARALARPTILSPDQTVHSS